MLVCSSVLGSLNVMDIPYGASYMAAMVTAWPTAAARTLGAYL